MIVYLVSDIASVCLMASLNYVVVYVLREEADEFMLIMLIYIIGSIASIPIWFKLSQKMNNNKKLFIIACIVNVIFLVPIGFITDLNIFLIMAIFLGIGMTGFKIALIPLFADTLDEALVFNERHIEASYSGFLVFILRFSLFAQALIFGIVHTITGFNPSPNAPQTPLAIFGIQLHFALIPAILFVIGILIFWKSYALTPEKTAELKEKIKELNL
jgi:Na+/melibiose symporter-like transporter